MESKEYYSKSDVMAGIVTYQPDLIRLGQCISAIQNQVAKIMIYDNGSENVDKIEAILKNNCNSYHLVKSTENNGIATALSEIMKTASDNGFSWVLTMDQDSLLQPGTVEAYIKGANNLSSVGMLTCLIKDRNFTDEKNEKQSEDYEEVPFCITSAAFANVEVYKQTPGYDESFFIDCVDFDICYSIREQGYKIYRINYTGLVHEVGHGENRKFLWKSIVVYHEKPLRIYYFARNTKRLYKKHKYYGVFNLIKKEMALLIRILLYEDNKKKKLGMFIKGILE